jgi:hypothetical protein
MPIYIPKAFAGNYALAFIGNTTDVHSKLSLIFMDTSNFCSKFNIKTYNSIPKKIRSNEPLLARIQMDMPWAKTTKPIGMALFPTTIPIFFGQKLVEG